jgi:threonine synthase
MQFYCELCNKRYPVHTHSLTCDCGGLFRVVQENARINFSAIATDTNHSIWRYKSAMPHISESSIQRVTMGEGGTPLISIGEKVYGKADYFMPTLSFKDRGAAVLVAAMVDQQVANCVIDSSGNAGTAVAAYCTRVGIGCDVFVPGHTSQKKVEQIRAHGATVHAVEGTREQTAKAALAYVEKTQSFYASHIYNPIFLEGTKTYIYELFEQYTGCLPDVIITPVGNGTLLLGIALALQELKEWNYITEYPRLLAVQAENCAPLAYAFTHNLSTIMDISTTSTLAEGIASARPARGNEILRVMKELHGEFITVSEEEILNARDYLAKRGIYVELTSAANYAGYEKSVQKGLLDAQATVVVPLCGAGLKSSH